MAQITLSGTIGHSNPVLSIIDILDAQGGMRTIPTFTSGALSTEFAGIPNKVKQYVSTITVTDTNSIYYLKGITATEIGSWEPLVPLIGYQGPQGASGSIGINGSQGPQGFQGPMGFQGFPGISSGATYYFNQSQASDVSPYRVLTTVPDGPEQTVTAIGVTAGGTRLVQQFLTPQLGFGVIPAGTQRFHFHFLKDAITHDFETYATIELANSSGIGYGTLFQSGTSLITYIDAVTPAECTPDLVLSTATINPTDRMIVKVYAKNVGSGTHNITLYTEGTSYYSFVVTSVGVVGNQGPLGPQGVAGPNNLSGTTNYVAKFTGATTIGVSTAYEDNSGNWGFGTASTSFAKLNILTPAISGTRESVLSVQVSDNSSDRYILGNGTVADNRFIPTHVGFVGGSYSSLLFRGLGLSTYDSGTSPYVSFLAAVTSSSTDPNNGVLSNPVNRPLFSWGSVNESMRILANGNLGLNITLPTSKLHVASIDNIATFEYTNAFGLSAGDNFTFNSLIFGDDISLQATRGLNTTRLIGYNGDGQSYFNDGSIISYPDQSIRMNGETTFAKTITYELPGIPVLATGEIVYFGLSSVALVPGDIYYYATNQEWEPADTATHGNKLLGIPLGATISDGILVNGFAKFPSNSNYSGFVNNSARQYLNSTPGSFSEVGPTASGEVVRIIGYCVNTDTLYFRPDTTWVTIL